MPLTTALTKRLQLTHPIIQAPMAGGGDTPNAILPFPLQNALTRPLRTAAAKAGRAEFLSLWAGQGVRMARRQTAAELVATLAQEADVALERLARTRVAAPPA